MIGSDEQNIFGIISLFISKRLMFTAFDVTKAARKLPMHVLHKEVRKLVHSYDFPSDYSKEQVDVVKLLTGTSNDSVPKPIVYFPAEKQVKDYVPVDLSDDTTLTTPVSTCTTGTQFQTHSAFNTGNPLSPVLPNLPNSVFPVNLDNRGRYCVRSKVISKAGFNKGDVVYLMCDNGEITITDHNPGIVDTIMTVDKYNNLLIFSSYLKRTFGTVPTNLDINIGSRKITIRKYN